MRRDIEFNAEGLTLRGWSYVPDGAKKMKYFLAALLLVSSLAMSATVQARTNESGVRPQANRIYGREVAAPPWSAACMTDQGPSVCGEPMWVYDTIGDHAGKKTALSPELNAPHRKGGDKPHVDWPANMILG
jgi:hypothetical protein